MSLVIEFNMNVFELLINIKLMNFIFHLIFCPRLNFKLGSFSLVSISKMKKTLFMFPLLLNREWVLNIPYGRYEMVIHTRHPLKSTYIKEVWFVLKVVALSFFGITNTYCLRCPVVVMNPRTKRL